MLKKLRLAFSLALVISLLLVIPASSDAPVTVKIGQVNIDDHPNVSISFSAWDLNGLPLKGLTAQDVFIQEDDYAEIHPAELQTDTNAVLSVALVLDVSGSMAGQPLTDARNAANRFLDKLSASDQAAVIAFSEGVDTDPVSFNPKREVGFSSNLTNAFNLIEGLTAAGGTEVYNAVEKAAKMTARLPAGHRAILLLTDGRNDPANVGDPESAIQLAKEENIPVFVIGLGGEIDETYLRRLTSETGGFYISTPHSSELSVLFNDMAALLKTDYSLIYPSTLKKDGNSHALNLRIVSSKGEASSQTVLGPLPSSTLPVAATAIQETIAPQPTPVSKQEYGLGWDKILLGGGVLFLLLMIVIFSVTRKKKSDLVEKCTNCGAVLTNPGPCPMCGSMKRIKVKNK